MDLETVSDEGAWVATVGTVVAAHAAGSLLFRDAVYGGFLWQYFWGPVYADAHSATCAVWDGGARTLLFDSSACAAAAGPVAYPGYTLVSEVGYVVTLLAMLVGVILLLRRVGLGEDRPFFYALFPFMFFGGALRVVEDANDAVPAGVEAAITYPLNALIISPVIYFTVFFITLGALVLGVALEERGLVDRYEYPLAGIGALVLVATVGYLAVLAATTSYVEFHPQFVVLTLAFATLTAGITWWLLGRYVPAALAGTGPVGLVIIWGHAVDGVANVIGLDWAAELGLGYDLVPKHPVNQFVVDVTASLQPASVTAAIGDAWPFLLVKLVAASAVVAVFDEQIFEESPRFAILMLVAVLAVGLGPGTRDMLRATFGI